MPNIRSSDFVWGVGLGIAGVFFYTGWRTRKAAKS